MLSIIIPAHNEKDNLKQLFFTLSGIIQRQKKVSIEVFIILSADNTDGTENLTITGDFHIIRCDRKGRAAQMNLGAQLANGDMLAFLHADSIPPPAFADNIVDALSSVYDAGLFSYKFDKSGPLLKINEFFTSRNGLFTGAGDQCLFIKTSVFNHLGQFNESQLIMEDFEFFDRIKRHKIKYTLVKNNLIVSSRKYDFNSYLRVNFSNLVLFLMYKLGYSAEKIKKTHNTMLHLPNDNYR